MNQLLVSKLMSGIVRPLSGLVKWDRYGLREDDSGFIFGWIKRDDRFYDFVVVRFWLDWEKNGQFFCSYDTSSKMYSREVGHRLGSNLEGYVDCRPAGELLPQEELVAWQKSDGYITNKI